jgi:hypothetical protein
MDMEVIKNGHNGFDRDLVVSFNSFVCGVLECRVNYIIDRFRVLESILIERKKLCHNVKEY